MVTRNLALTTIAVGIVLFVSGVYGVIGPHFSLLLAGVGILVLLGGATLLLLATRPWRMSAPHSYVVGITVAAFGLHAYEHIYESSGDAPIGFLLWSMVPYALCLALSTFLGIRKSVIAGAAIALIFDLWGHYVVFLKPQSSTAALALLFIPLWSTIIAVPVATFFAWLITKWRKCGKRDALQ